MATAGVSPVETRDAMGQKAAAKMEVAEAVALRDVLSFCTATRLHDNCMSDAATPLAFNVDGETKGD